jgi:hypothetical protein
MIDPVVKGKLNRNQLAEITKMGGLPARLGGTFQRWLGA